MSDFTTLTNMSPLVNTKFLLIIGLSLLLVVSQAAPLGQWKLLQKNAGISAMHAQLLPNDRVVMFDRTDAGRSNISLPAGKCRNDRSDLVLKIDCTAHSIEYDVQTNTLRPLMVQTDTWCSSGSLMSDGSLVQTGGYNDGDRKVRTLTPSYNNNSCDWVENGNMLKVKRWYATNHRIPNDSQIIIGGINANSYEYIPKTSDSGLFELPFLAQTYDKGVWNNLYPFVFLNTDGNLFIYSNNRAILFSYKNNSVVRTYPTVPGGDPRNYPSTGSAVLLPLRDLTSTINAAEVLVCGGAPMGSFGKAMRGTFVEALRTCGRIRINDPNPQWEIDTMPMARTMGDMILLPNGNVLIINGAGSGTAGWELARDPVLSPVVYRPNNAKGSRFEVQNPTTIPRMYHSVATLLRDGRVLVAGSNTHAFYNFTGVLFPTELRMEAFHPSYLDPLYDPLRPEIVSPSSMARIEYGEVVVVRFQLSDRLDPGAVSVTMVSPSFTTHSFSMNQRLLVLPVRQPPSVLGLWPKPCEIHVVAPASPVLAQPGYYMLCVVHQEIPSTCIWVQIH